MNPSVLQGASLDRDSLGGKKINQYKSVAFCFADVQFWNSTIIYFYTGSSV